jgi:dienelactone hydrolase
VKREAVRQLGSGGRLVGIVSEPSEPSASPARIACVLANAGLVPKAGPYRLYVQLARRLADDGVPTLRFDLGGLGDSAAAHTHVPLRARTALDIRAAVDHVMARGDVDGVVLGGLCSGAEDSFRYAETDPRVRGVVMIDPFSYRTAGWSWRHLAHRVARRTLRAAGVFEPTVAATRTAAHGVVSYHYMEQVEATRILRALLARRAHVHFLYTGGSRDTFNHRSQLAAMFPGLPLAPHVVLDHLPHLDHTQLLAEDRRAVVDAIATRLATAIATAARP